MPKYFGTDGVRGLANSCTMNPDIIVKLSQAAGHLFKRQGHEARVLIGKDTRLSGYMIESALVSGFTSVGMDVVLTGPLPTPAIGMLSHSLRADLGVMISASHNPFMDNGIKFFGPNGFKLSDAEEAAIEYLMQHDPVLAAPDAIGRVTRMDGAAERYTQFAKQSFPVELSLEGLRVVVDAANGAAFKVARQILWELGADVVALACEPDGRNINAGCGSTAPELCQAAVREHQADLGICLDGDADRVHLIDETGAIVDGDQMMALIAERLNRTGRLRQNCVVATIMSNLGLERHLARMGIRLERTAVGDRYVVERMRQIGANLGGEQSGHLVLTDYTTTGDGMIAALQALAEMVETGRPASEALLRFQPLPQVSRNVAVAPHLRQVDRPDLRLAIDRAERSMGAAGRLIVRASGTEPVIRIMAEGEDHGMVEQVVQDIADVVGGGSASLHPAALPVEIAAVSP